MRAQNHWFLQTQMCSESDKQKTSTGRTQSTAACSEGFLTIKTFSFEPSCSPVFALGFMHFNVPPVVSKPSVNLSEHQQRRPPPGLNSKGTRRLPKLGRPTEERGLRAGEEEAWKVRPRNREARTKPKKKSKAKDGRRRGEGGEEWWEGEAR